MDAAGRGSSLSSPSPAGRGFQVQALPTLLPTSIITVVRATLLSLVIGGLYFITGALLVLLPLVLLLTIYHLSAIVALCARLSPFIAVPPYLYGDQARQPFPLEGDREASLLMHSVPELSQQGAAVRRARPPFKRVPTPFPGKGRSAYPPPGVVSGDDTPSSSTLESTSSDVSSDEGDRVDREADFQRRVDALTIALLRAHLASAASGSGTNAATSASSSRVGIQPTGVAVQGLSDNQDTGLRGGQQGPEQLLVALLERFQDAASSRQPSRAVRNLDASELVHASDLLPTATTSTGSGSGTSDSLSLSTSVLASLFGSSQSSLGSLFQSPSSRRLVRATPVPTSSSRLRSFFLPPSNKEVGPETGTGSGSGRRSASHGFSRLFKPRAKQPGSSAFSTFRGKWEGLPRET